MYVPPAFAVKDRQWAMELIDRNPFGILITCGQAYPLTTHLPMLATERDSDLYVAGHVARGNPHAASILAGEPATAIFSGAHAFVSASWYEEPYETVPTWNYSVVHASGRLAVADARWVLGLLVDRFEGSAPEAWRLERLPEDFLEKQLRAIIAFEVRVERLEGKAKLSQNRTAPDRARVEAALARSQDPLDRKCAQDMRRERLHR